MTQRRLFQSSSEIGSSIRRSSSVVMSYGEPIEIMDDEDEPEIGDEDEEKWAIGIGNLIGLRPQSPAPTPRKQRKSAIKIPRNAPIQMPFAEIPSKVHMGMNLRALMTVELAVDESQEYEKYLRIKNIVKNSLNGEVMLRGWLFRRANSMGGLIDTKLNEVLLILDVDLDDNRDILEQSVLEVPISEVIMIKKLVMTNKSMETRRFDRTELRKGKEFVYDNLELFCRWKLINRYLNSTERRKGRAEEWSLESLRESECTPQEGICDEVRRQLHRETDDAICGGSSNAVRSDPAPLRSLLYPERCFSQQDDLEKDMLDLSVAERPSRRHLGKIDLTNGGSRISSSRGHEGSGRNFRQKYTFADICKLSHFSTFPEANDRQSVEEVERAGAQSLRVLKLHMLWIVGRSPAEITMPISQMPNSILFRPRNS